MSPARCRVPVLAWLVLAAGVSGGCAYNTLTSQDTAIDTQWAEVEKQLQRRSRIVPGLVETVKGYAGHEREVFQAVAAAGAMMAGARSPEEKIAAANAESGALARLLAIVEDYPQLKVDTLFAEMQKQLASAENGLAVERMRYNEKVQQYNALRSRFPSNVTAGIFRFRERPFFRPPADSKPAPKTDAKLIPDP